MSEAPDRPEVTAEVVLPCTELDATIAFFVERLRFRLLVLSPADEPTTAVLAGHGLRLRLRRGDGPAAELRLVTADPEALAPGRRQLVAPGGTRVEIVGAERELPPLRSRRVRSRGDGWTVGRAGMLYRDLIPGRLDGHWIASHIRIPDGGPVPDYVHHHDVRFQMIYAYRGWVRVVYEDQGPPFVLEAGDCVLQPPGIRHRVLECSAGLEVIELGSPAVHDTHVEHEIELPTGRLRPERSFGGQRFVRHVARGALWSPADARGLEARDTGIATATDGRMTARVLRPTPTGTRSWQHRSSMLFWFVLSGRAVLECDGEDASPLAPGDAVTLPAGRALVLRDGSSDLELLEVSTPARLGLG